MVSKFIKVPLRKIYFLSIQIFNITLKSRFKRIYGDFDNEDYKEYELNNLPNESTSYDGEIIKWAKDNLPKDGDVLLCGEGDNVKDIFKECLSTNHISTSALSNSDFNWNFEEDLPKGIKKYDLIISRSMFEHLIDPYKHFKDLVSLLKPSGILIVSTASQFCPYHRYPIDSLRFFPDWFEEISKRFKLNILKKKLRFVFISYMFQKQAKEVKKK